MASTAIRRRQGDERRTISSATIPAEGIELRLDIAGIEPLDLSLLDYDNGLPAAGRRLLEARPADVVPGYRGDQTVVHVSATL